MVNLYLSTKMKTSFVLWIVLLLSATQMEALVMMDSRTNDAPNLSTARAPSTNQLNCKNNSTICLSVCNESKDLPYSSTFCDTVTGSCICDCRDTISKSCEKTPFTPCFQDCVRKNPNPNVYLYEGGNCLVPQNGTFAHQCACECSLRDDYIESNDIF